MVPVISFNNCVANTGYGSMTTLERATGVIFISASSKHQNMIESTQVR